MAASCQAAGRCERPARLRVLASPDARQTTNIFMV